jgi:uncharacterized protein (TIGR03086 family)
MPGDTTVLLAGSIRYALTAVALVTPGELASPTPCAGWDLQALLRHLADSMAAVTEAVGAGSVGPAPPRCPGGDPVRLLRDRAAELLCAWFESGDEDAVITVGGLRMPAWMVVGTGAVEITVHGWDVFAASGHGRVVPDDLARPLYRLSPRLVAVRAGLFGEPVAVPPCASAGDRLVAYLGRDPGEWRRPPSFPGLVTSE